jgi:proline dehydrogenase
MQIFENTEIAFRHRSDKELKKASLLFKFMEYPSLVKISGIFAKFVIRTRLPIGWLVKPTIFRQFCAGESLGESRELVDFLAKFNVRSVLDYAAENQESDGEIQSVISEITRTMDFAKKNPAVSFSVFKPSGLAPVKVLARAGAINTSSFQVEQETDNFRNNIKLLCQEAYNRGIPVMIDAEESHYQDIVDKVATEMMELYNKNEAIVFNTLQMYRHDRLEFLEKCLQDSGKGNYHLGLKIVRGPIWNRKGHGQQN